MYRVLIADDDLEDRELLKIEIRRALEAEGAAIHFEEAASIKQAKDFLSRKPFDLLTLDIQFDRLNEGLESLPEIFDEYPTLNIIVVSGKLNKNEVMEKLFQFTKDNVLKGKRWLRHFDVLDKKDEKAEAIRQAYLFAEKQERVDENIRSLFLLAEEYLHRDEIDKCLEIYQKIQNLAPGDVESRENIDIIKGRISVGQIQSRMRKGDRIVASLLLGHYLEGRLKAYTRHQLGKTFPSLSDCFRELKKSSKIQSTDKDLFYKVLRMRNKAIHHPSAVSEDDAEKAFRHLEMLEIEQQ